MTHPHRSFREYHAHSERLVPWYSMYHIEFVSSLITLSLVLQSVRLISPCCYFSCSWLLGSLPFHLLVQLVVVVVVVVAVPVVVREMHAPKRHPYEGETIVWEVSMMGPTIPVVEVVPYDRQSSDENAVPVLSLPTTISSTLLLLSR